jgi:NDP-sugar pyrophosphorylase family protein
MKVIVPCAGRSTRFPDMPPKWMLPDYDGQPMVAKAVSGLGVDSTDLVITILREHEDRFSAIDGLRRALGSGFQVVTLDEPTKSQSETVAETLRRTGLNEPFLVKDSDNYFRLSPVETGYNYISVASLNDFDSINPRNKSYCRLDQEGIVVNFREKVVISDTFSVGGYWFTSPVEFLDTYDRLTESERLSGAELYISDIIGAMILDGRIFKGRSVSDYQDWGTVHEWRAKLEARQVLMVSLDGFLFERGSPFFSPTFEQVRANAEAVQVVRSLAAAGDMIVYVSIRPPSLEALTRQQLEREGLPQSQVVFGCAVAPWTLVASPHPTLPFTTAKALELDSGDPNLPEKIRSRL